MIGAFGVELGESVEKAFTKEGRERNRATRSHDRELRSKLSRKERVNGDFYGVLATAKDAPKGRRLAAAKEHSAYMSRDGKGKHVLHKPGTTHAGARAHVREQRGVSKSAFGVEGAVTKADSSSPPISGGRKASALTFGYLHSAVAAKKGQKLRATGSSLGHEIAGSAAGGAAGARIGAVGGSKGRVAGAVVGQLGGDLAGRGRALVTNNRAGRYKRES